MNGRDKRIVAGVGVIIVGVAAFIFKPPRPVVETTAASVWDTWVLLDQPEGEPLVGKGWSLSGPSETTCYSASVPTVQSQSVDRYQVSWNSSTSHSVALRIAQAVGAGGAVSNARQGTITFDSIVVLRAENVRPLFGSCEDAASDLLPRLPVVTEMIGARGFDMIVTDSTAASLAAESIIDDPTNGDATVEFVANNHLHVSFGSLRWVGAHLTGFTAGREEIEYSDEVPLGAVSSSDRWNFVAEHAEPGRYILTIQSRYPPMSSTTIGALQDGAVFPVSLGGAALSAGSYVYGQLEIAPGLSGYRVVLRKRGYTPQSWTRNEQREALNAWVSNHMTQ